MRGIGRQPQRKPGQNSGDEQGEQRHGHINFPGRDAAGERGGHLAVVIEPTEGEHDTQQEPERHQDAQVLQRAERNQLEHDALRKLVDGSTLQDTGDLVGQQDDQQDARHYEPGRHDFAQNVAPENIPQPTSLHRRNPLVRI